MENIHLHHSNQEQWVVVNDKGEIMLFSLKGTRSESIKRFVSLWGPELPVGKWKHWYRKGYRCVKVKVQITKV